MIIDRICEVCREVFGQTDTAKWGNNEPPFETICPSCTATPGPEGPQIPSATFRPREGITCPGLLLDFFWSSDAEALAWIRQHVSTEGWPDEACTDEPEVPPAAPVAGVLSEAQYSVQLQNLEATAEWPDSKSRERGIEQVKGKLKAHDAALRELVQQAREDLRNTEEACQELNDGWNKLTAQLATAEGERDRLAEERRALEQDIRDLRNVARGILIQSGMKERLLCEMRTIYGHDPHAQRGLALLAGEGEAGHVE